MPPAPPARLSQLPGRAHPPSPSFLMCRPTYYTIAYEINPWMSLKRQVHYKNAQLQWNHLYTLLRRLKVNIKLIPPHAGIPDLVFTANAGLVQGKTLIRSSFRFPQRQREEPIIERYFRKRGFRILTLPGSYHFEGEGDALWFRDTLILGFRFRSDALAHEWLSKKLQARVLPVELADGRFYHLDTCFCPLDSETALWFPDAFDRYGRRVIENSVPDLIAVSEKDAMRFACNAIGVGKAVVMQAGVSRRLAKALSRRGFVLYPVALSEFLKAGGAAKCLVLRLT